MRRLVLTLLLALGAVSLLYAQRYDAVVERNLWNEGYNRAGLRTDTLSYSYAELWGGVERGGMTNHSNSDRVAVAGIKSESILHFKRISFQGSLSYDYFDAEQMWGSMFINPGSWVVDIYEYTPGRKVRENYAFIGAVGYDVAKSWQLGLLVDFGASNYAKRKDLRHKNTALDIQVAPSVRWSRGDWSWGVAYIFQKRSESIKAEEIGTTPDSYRAFFDSGMFYGKEALWTSADLHLNISGLDNFPIKEQLHGVELNLGYRSLLLSAEYHKMGGDTGEKGVVWHSFDADRWGVRLGWQHHSEESLHTLSLALQRSITHNNEKVLMTQTVGGVSIVQEYGEVPIFAEIMSAISLDYDWQRGANRIVASVCYSKEQKQSSLLYPYLKEQQLERFEASIYGLCKIKCVEIMGGLNFGFGSTDYSSKEVSDTLPSSSYPKRQQLFADWYDEYMTSPILGCNFGVRVSLPKGFYIEPSARYYHGFNLKVIPQNNRIETLLKVGCRW